MAQYMVLYSGGPGMGMDPDERNRIMGEWGAWYGKMGNAIVDGGAPFGDAKSLSGNGVQDGALGDMPATGYTIVEADSLEMAAKACEDHPHLKYDGQIQVFTCIDMSGTEESAALGQDS